MSITAAQQAKAKIALSKKLNTYEFGIVTKAEFMERLFNSGATSKQSVKPSVEYNRTKFNRMNGEQQQEYERKMSIKIPCYQIHLTSGSFYEVSKTEYEYFNTLTPCQTK